MNHDSNDVNCFQSLYYCTDVIRYGKMNITDSIKLSTARATLRTLISLGCLALPCYLLTQWCNFTTSRLHT